MLRIARAALDLARMAAAVERQEVRRLSAEPGGHVHLVRIGGEVHQRPRLELEERRPRVAVLLVLPHRVPPVLARAGILQLAGGDGQAVDGEDAGPPCRCLPGWHGTWRVTVSRFCA